MRKIIIVVAISVILGLSVAVGSHIMALRPEPSIQSPPEPSIQSPQISLTEELLTKIEERLENIQEDLAELKSRSEESRSLTENSF